MIYNLKRSIGKFSLRLILITLVTFSLFSPSFGQTLSTKPQKGWTINDLMKVSTVTMAEISPDGTKIAFIVRKPMISKTESKYIAHLYLTDTVKKKTIQLTRGKDISFNPRWSPDGKYIAFISKRSGKRNVRIIPVNGGESYPLTSFKTGMIDFKWSPDGRLIACTAVDPPGEKETMAEKEKDDAKVMGENIRMNHLHIISTVKKQKGSYLSHRATKGDFNVTSFDWSPDGRQIVFAHTITPLVDDEFTSDISMIDLPTGKITPLCMTKASETTPVYSPDGTKFAFLKTETPSTEFCARDVSVMDLKDKKITTLAPTFNQLPSIIAWSKDGKSVYYRDNKRTRSELGALPVDGSKPVILCDDNYIISSVSLDGKGTAFGLSMLTLTSPEEIYISKTGNFQPEKLTGINKNIPQHPLGKTELISWKSDDDLEIEGLLTYPANFEKGKKYPLLVEVHGGPAGCFLQGFPVMNFYPYPLPVFSSRGYLVLRCNIRGSNGYGAGFRKAVTEDWGGKDFRDLVTGIDHVIDMGIANPDRIGIMGWSYGGYMTAWAITQTDRFKAASVGAGVCDLVSMAGTTDLTTPLSDYLGGKLWEKFELYLSRSPITHIKNVTTATLIQHGAGDTRVPYSQALELYNALKKRGVKTRLVTYPRSGHSIPEPKLIMDAMKQNLEWFKRYVN